MTAQDLTTWNQKRLQRNKIGMIVLGSWAIAHIGTGVSLRGSSEGSMRHFHEMNIYWNLVNLGLAGVGVYAAVSGEAEGLSLAESMNEQQKMEKILLFNAGLDIGYILGGLYMIERSKRSDSQRLKGFGQSVVLQGAFLFIFDLGFFIVQNQQAKPIYELLSHLSLSESGVGLRLNF